ncbi:MAG: hypothetical protein WCS31_11040 [Verrucomicrobiae bacterium]
MNLSSHQAWVVTADMGYGHQRAAYPFRDIARERIITANSDTVVGAEEKKMWRQFQGFYETVSRLGRIPLAGPWLWKAYDYFQSISPFYPFRDLSKPTFGSLRLHRMLHRGFARSVPAYASRENLPFLTTFFAVALAADHFGLPDVSCVVTDSDINRIWVADKPKKSGVVYFAPTPRAEKRLLLYGVPRERVFFTGFPLPDENVSPVRDDLARRIAVLDPRGVFRAKYRQLVAGELGPIPAADRPLTIVFAVGGAGAQAEIARGLLLSLRPALEGGRVRIHLVAGTRLEVNCFFLETIRDTGLAEELGKSVFVLASLSKTDYFAKFNQVIREADVLWTKPSELSFFCALGLPVVMTPPIGSHEACNSDWLIKNGAGLAQEDPAAVADWIFDWQDRGLLALSAFNGFYHAPRHGTENIKALLFAKDRTLVKMRM